MYSYRLPSDEASRVSVATLSNVVTPLGFIGLHEPFAINTLKLDNSNQSILRLTYNIIEAVSSSYYGLLPDFVDASTIGDKIVITNMAATAARILPASATGEFIAGAASISLNANESAILVRYNASNWIRI